MSAIRLLTGSATLLLAACVSTQPVSRSPAVTPATAEQVAGCQYVDDLVGVSGMYGVFADKGIENARKKALEKAASLGATHVVWADANTGYGSTSAAGKAYRCSP